MNEVRIIIDRILLTDFDLPPSDARRLRTLIESELMALIQQQGLPAVPKASGNDSNSVDLSPGWKPRQLARRVATQLWENLHGSS